MRFVLVPTLLCVALAAPSCCWSKWGDVKTGCGGYPAGGKGGYCNTDFTKKCSGSAGCPATPVPTPAPTPPGPTPPPTPAPPVTAPPVPHHPPAPAHAPLPEKNSQEVLGWLENWGPDVSCWNSNIPFTCNMGCLKGGPFLRDTTPYSTINYGFALLGKHPNSSQVGCGTRWAEGPCPAWDGQNIYLADAAKADSIAVNSATNINQVSSGIVVIADVVRMARMHPAGPKRAKITLGGWSDYARFGNAANGVKAAKLIGKLVAYTFADGIDLDLEHLRPYSGMGDEFGGLIAFISQVRLEFDQITKNWAATANARIKALTQQFHQKCGRCAAVTRHWFVTNINHLKEVAANPAPHLEISWTTRFNAFVNPDDKFNYLMPDSAVPDVAFETDNEGSDFYPQVAHIVDTVNIMAYDEGSIKGKPIKLNFATILDNFAKYGNVSRSKINMGFEPGPQAAHGKWEGADVDKAAATEIAQKKTGGGVALWAINPSPSKFSNASRLCPVVGQAMNDIIKPVFAYGKAPNFTKCGSDGMWPGMALSSASTNNHLKAMAWPEEIII